MYTHLMVKVIDPFYTGPLRLKRLPNIPNVQKYNLSEQMDKV